MAATANEPKTTLELAAAYLQQARLQLICCEPVEAQVLPSLSRAAQLLETVHLPLGSPEAATLCRLLQEIRETAFRARLLLDAAANFHCGIALAGPATTDGYAPDGTWETSYPSDQICLNA